MTSGHSTRTCSYRANLPTAVATQRTSQPSLSRFCHRTSEPNLREKDAYLGSARLTDYYVIDSTRRYVAHYFWPPDAEQRGRLFTAEYRRGPVPVPALGLALAFEQIYAGTSVPSIIHPIRPDGQEASPIRLD